MESDKLCDVKIEQIVFYFSRVVQGRFDFKLLVIIFHNCEKSQNLNQSDLYSPKGIHNYVTVKAFPLIWRGNLPSWTYGFSLIQRSLACTTVISTPSECVIVAKLSTRNFSPHHPKTLPGNHPNKSTIVTVRWARRRFRRENFGHSIVLTDWLDEELCMEW